MTEIGASADPCSDTYRGSAAWSEPETQNQRDYTNGLSGSKEFLITCHTHGEYILLPWGYTIEEPPRYAETVTITT